ncbi:uncharacterized protein EAE97_002349 [Botrytis byssoidea]|uniref:Major facilitator superfamily (MFS) profile domain-containing protein n=1 Tax=Botrytis byssoidea TaxID=139641 RepID=A0A9P5IQZ3_9HELO|nr:uncharacterized protein EAE97_002349 [Botrytis byssoidea]KAF7950797.1 hypothetical protein EAE97_002349 [Botrytis byssoidea]
MATSLEEKSNQDPKTVAEVTEVTTNRADGALQETSLENIDEAIIEGRPKKSLSFKLAFIGLAASMFVFQMDATSLGISLPTVAEELHGESLQSFWANMSYTLCGLIMQPLWASISDIFGRKPSFYICMAFFFIGSIVFALAKDMNTIIVGRVLQGFGGGGIDVLVEIILSDITTLKERSFCLGLMAIPNAVGNILGPSIGAIFSSYASWRWIGWVNLPILGISAPLIVFFLHLRPVELDEKLSANLKKLDWIGMMLVVTGITIFVLPLSWAGSLFPWKSWQTLLPILLGAVLLVIFVVYEAKPSVPILPHRLFHSRTANMTLAAAFVHGMILISLLQYLPLFYQTVELETAIRSAVSLLPTVIISVVFAAISMMMVSVVGGYVWIIRFGWIIIILGTGLLALFDVGSSSSLLFGLPILWGMGVSLLRLLLLTIQASVKNVDDIGLAIGLLLTIRMFGGLIGPTVASTIFNSVFSTSIAAVELTGSLSQLNNPSKAVSFIPELRSLEISPKVLDAVLRVYLGCFKTIFYTMAGLGGLGLITSLLTQDLDLNRKDVGQQRFEE